MFSEYDMHEMCVTYVERRSVIAELHRNNFHPVEHFTLSSQNNNVIMEITWSYSKTPYLTFAINTVVRGSGCITTTGTTLRYKIYLIIHVRYYCWISYEMKNDCVQVTPTKLLESTNGSAVHRLESVRVWTTGTGKCLTRNNDVKNTNKMAVGQNEIKK